MRPDRVKERLLTKNNQLTSKAATDKMVDLINLYHSLEYRNGTDDDKNEARELIKKEVSKLKSRVGSGFSANCFYYLKDRQAWNNAKESYLS